MADMIFDKTNKTLEWKGQGSWTAVSGPHGKGSLPTGDYKVVRRNITPYTRKIRKSFQDTSGQGFFVPISPNFATGRNGLGIHPDGNVAGTEGCIGLKGNTKSFYEAIKKLPLGEDINLQVK